MKQLITEPTHILENTSSCIGLIFTNQPNIVLDSGVHSSLHPKFHYQIIYSKLYLNYLFYPPPYTRDKAETDLINHSIENVDTSNFFLGKNVHEQVEIFNHTMLNIFHNFIPNKTISCDDQDQITD